MLSRTLSNLRFSTSNLCRVAPTGTPGVYTASIPTNIVEGCGRKTQKELGSFLQISFASCNELEYHLRVAHDYGVLDSPKSKALTDDVIEVRMLLSGLLSKVRSSA